MKDQYGNAVPAGLVVLPDFWLLSPAEVEIVGNLDWYESKGVLLVPENDVGGEEPSDYGIKIDEDGNIVGEVKKVDACLHRYSEADGFYHI